MTKPLLFVDIDGVLNPYDTSDHGLVPDGFVEHRLFPDDDEPVRVAQVHGTWLAELAEAFDLMWASSWTAEDRATLGTVLALPTFVDAVRLPTGRFDPAMKVPEVDRLGAGRPLAWIDDLLTATAWDWAGGRAAPTLLVPIDPSRGMTRTHVDRLLRWAAAIPDGDDAVRAAVAPDAQLIDSIIESLADERTIDIVTIGRRSRAPRTTEIWTTIVGGVLYIAGTPAAGPADAARAPRDWLANVIAEPALTVRLKESIAVDLPARALRVEDPVERRRLFHARQSAYYREFSPSEDDFVAGAPVVRVEFLGEWSVVTSELVARAVDGRY